MKEMIETRDRASELVMILTCSREVTVSNLAHTATNLNEFSSDSPEKCCYESLNKAMSAPFRIFAVH
jgi:hypothetical protein